MSGNLINDYVKTHQPQAAPQAGYQPYVGNPVSSTGKQTVDTTPQADTYEKKDNRKTFLILGSWFGLNKLITIKLSLADAATLVTNYQISLIISMAQISL